MQWLIKTALAFASAIYLAGCTSPATKILPSAETIKLVYPSVQPLPMPANPDYYTIHFSHVSSVPLSISALAKECKNKSQLAEKACMSANASNSNIFVGLTERQYLYLLLNLQKTSQYASELKSRVKGANAIFSYWNNKNKPSSVSK